MLDHLAVEPDEEGEMREFIVIAAVIIIRVLYLQWRVGELEKELLAAEAALDGWTQWRVEDLRRQHCLGEEMQTRHKGESNVYQPR